MSEIPVPPPAGTDLAADRGYELLIANVVTFSLALLACILRVVARRCSKAGFWWDDYLIIPAISLSVFTFASHFVDSSFGKHLWAVGYDAQVQSVQMLFVDLVVCIVNLFFLKCSILALYWRIFSASRFRWAIWVASIPVVAWFITAIVMAGLQCVPISKFWDIFEAGSCSVSPSYWIGGALFHLATDLILLLLPIPFVIQMKKTAWSQKFLIIGSFLLGSFCLAFTPVRLHYLAMVDPNSPDLTWNYTDSVIWVTVENNISIIAVCVPALRPIYKYLTTGSFVTQLNTHHKRGSSLAQFWPSGQPTKAHSTATDSAMRNDLTVGSTEKQPGGVLHLQGLSPGADSHADEKTYASASLVPVIDDWDSSMIPVINGPDLEDVDLSSETEDDTGSESKNRGTVRYEIDQKQQSDDKIPLSHEVTEQNCYTVYSYSEMETGQHLVDRDSMSSLDEDPVIMMDRNMLTPQYENENRNPLSRSASRTKVPSRSPSRVRVPSRSPARSPARLSSKIANLVRGPSRSSSRARVTGIEGGMF